MDDGFADMRGFQAGETVYAASVFAESWGPTPWMDEREAARCSVFEVVVVMPEDGIIRAAGGSARAAYFFERFFRSREAAVAYGARAIRQHAGRLAAVADRLEAGT